MALVSFLPRSKPKLPFLGVLCSETKRKRLLRRLPLSRLYNDIGRITFKEQIPTAKTLHYWVFDFCFRLACTQTFFVSFGKSTSTRRRFRRACDSFATPIFDFHKVISATTISNSTPSLVKTSLKKNQRCFHEKYLRTIRSDDATVTTTHVHHMFLYISLPLLLDYDVKMPNFAFHGEIKQATTKLEFNFKRVRLHLTIESKCVEIIEIKTERTQIHCLSDVLVAIASLDLKVTFICSSWTYRNNTSRNRVILFRRIEFKASYAIEFDDYATYKMNQLNSSEELDSSNTFYTSFWNFELTCTFSLKNCFHFSFLRKKKYIHFL